MSNFLITYGNPSFALYPEVLYMLNIVDATWASINRGILVCDECCSIHRSLGRHVSQVKSLRKGSWSSAQLQVNDIYNVVYCFEHGSVIPLYCGLFFWSLKEILDVTPVNNCHIELLYTT